jgi:hypothetical protein
VAILPILKGKKMAILKYLDLSTAHVRKGTMNPPNTTCLIAAYEYGALYYVPDEIPAECPADLKAVLEYAATNECAMVRLDADADVVNGLEVFDW